MSSTQIRRSRLTYIGAVVATGAALALFVGTPIAASSSQAKPRNSVIGVIASSTGDYAAVGEAYVTGVKLAQSQWQKQHPKEKVQVFFEDDGYNSRKALAAYQKLTGINKINALVNMSSPSIDAIYSKARKSNLPIGQGGEQGIPPKNDNVFQLLPGNIATEIALGKYVKARGHKKVAVFYSNSGVYVRFLAGFVKGYGGSVMRYGIPLDSTDYSSAVTKALSDNPDAFVFIDSPVQGANLVKQILLQTTKSIPMYFDADIQTGWQDYQKILGDTSVLNGSAAVVIRSKTAPAFVKAYKTKFGKEPFVGADWAYDSFNLLMRTRDTDRKKWIANMRKAKFSGAGGLVVFDQTGVRIPNFTVGRITNGQLPT